MLEILKTASKIYIVGLGLTGFSCARFLSSRGLAFSCIDTSSNPDNLSDFYKQFPSTPCFIGGDYKDIDFIKDDVLIVSPGISLSHPLIVKASQHGAIVTSDIEIFINKVSCPIIAITGSNGKSTVVTLISHILQYAGKKVCLAGNIGKAALDQLGKCPNPDVVVLELSSFQLERVKTLNADVVSILNISEDHMDRYHDIKEYRDAKANIFIGAKACVVNADDDLTFPDSIGIEQVSFGLKHAADFHLEKKDGSDWVFYNAVPLFSSNQLKIKGSHNILNVMASFAACYLTGIGFDKMVNAVKDFEGIAHRCQWLGEIQGINYFNDSKATNVGACIAAIEGLSEGEKNIILILGGQGKNSDYSPLGEIVSDHVKHTVLIGEDAQKIDQYIQVPVSFASSLEAAIEAARAQAIAGDTILLSPACASFDMFDNYQHRGDCFVHFVNKLAEDYL